MSKAQETSSEISTSLSSRYCPVSFWGCFYFDEHEINPIPSRWKVRLITAVFFPKRIPVPNDRDNETVSMVSQNVKNTGRGHKVAAMENIRLA